MLEGLIRDAASPDLISSIDLAGLLDDSHQLGFLGQLDAWSTNSQVPCESHHSHAAAHLPPPHPSSLSSLPQTDPPLSPDPPPSYQLFMQLVKQLGKRAVVEYSPWAKALSGLRQAAVLLRTAAAPSAGNSTAMFGFDAQTCYDALLGFIRKDVTGGHTSGPLQMNIGPMSS